MVRAYERPKFVPYPGALRHGYHIDSVAHLTVETSYTYTIFVRELSLRFIYYVCEALLFGSYIPLIVNLCTIDRYVTIVLSDVTRLFLKIPHSCPKALSLLHLHGVQSDSNLLRHHQEDKQLNLTAFGMDHQYIHERSIPALIYSRMNATNLRKTALTTCKRCSMMDYP